MIKKSKSFQKGIAALITIISLGGMIFIMSVTSAILAFWSNYNIKNVRDSNKAFYAASSGLSDALIRLERDKSFFNTGYNFSLYNTNDTLIAVSNNGPQSTINLNAQLGVSQKKIQAIIDINTTSGLITPSSTIEQTL